MVTAGLVSVVVPAYNAELYLEQCVNSVFGQSYESLELIVVDDGSSDRTGEMLKRFEEMDRRVKILCHPDNQNMGVSKSRRLGVAHASGEYIAFLDADDWFCTQKLEKQTAIMKSYPDCVLSHTGVQVQANSESDKNLFEENFNMFSPDSCQYDFRARHDYLVRNHICNSTVLVRSDYLRGLKFSFPQLFQFEDWTLWVLLSQFGKFHYLPEALSGYRSHDGSATHLVKMDTLRNLYSHFEFLLTVASLSKDQTTLDKVNAILEDLVSSLVSLYNPEFQGTNATGPLCYLDKEQVTRPWESMILLQSQNRELARQIDQMRKSVSYRIGRTITWPLRYLLK